MRAIHVHVRQMPLHITELLQTIGFQKFDDCTLEDGIVAFRRGSRAWRIPASAIGEIDVTWTSDEDGEHYCHLHVWHGTRKIVVKCFPDAYAFLAELRQLNPDLYIDGYLYTGEHC